MVLKYSLFWTSYWVWNGQIELYWLKEIKFIINILNCHFKVVWMTFRFETYFGEFCTIIDFT